CDRVHAGGAAIDVEIVEDEVHVLLVAGQEVLGVSGGGLTKGGACRQEKQACDDDAPDGFELPAFSHVDVSSVLKQKTICGAAMNRRGHSGMPLCRSLSIRT